MTCRFIMPFNKKVRIAIGNFGSQKIRIKGATKTGSYDWKTGMSMYFHAKWKIQHDIIASDPVFDFPYIIALGKGCFVGTSLMLMNPCTIPSGAGSWWGEGDEKIYVDNEKFPSTFGTGSEDYFNYSWGINGVFIHPYCGQPRSDGPANRGFLVNYRWQIVDRIPFNQNFSFYMELWHHDVTPGTSYGCTAYYYGTPGIRDDSVIITKHDLGKPQMPAEWTPKATSGANGFTFHEAQSLVTNMNNCQAENGWLWTEGSCLLWKPQGIGKSKDFKITVSQDGTYTLNITCKHSPDGGVFSVKSGDKIRFQNQVIVSTKADAVRSRTAFLGNLKLTKGEHVLTLSNESDFQSPEIGIDFIWLKKQ